MAKKKNTVFQALDKAISGNWGSQDTYAPHINSYDMSNYGNGIIYKTTDKDDYEQKKLELQQDRYLKDRWHKANVNLAVTAYAGLNNIKLMYRDADLMDAFPEIGAALDTYAEESCVVGSSGNIVSVRSKSDRVKSILEDLFVNRLNIQLMAPMIIRAMCKYGNQYMLLDVDHKNGVKGWKQLPVFNMERIECGIQNPYGAGASIAVNGITKDDADMSTQFIWLDDNNSQVPFRDWQIAHFRVLTNSLYLPYGCSVLNSARRHWRMLSLMEDMMLIYRLERSIERRVYKIFVGAIDDADVPAYMEQVANQFKRTPIVDPMTGQVDLRKNILPVHKDTPIPLMDGRTITIENLAKEFEDGKENFVYSIQDKTHKIVPGKVVWCGKNYTAEKLYKITLDDSSHMIIAGEHEIIMRDGTKKRADEVSIGESVMPFYRKNDLNGNSKMEYEKVYVPNTGKYEFTHTVISNSFQEKFDGINTVHHKDFNRFNNNPSNLQLMTWMEHIKLHSSLNSSERVKKLRREEGIRKAYRIEFKTYNESELHEQHNEIRRIANVKKWENEEKRKAIINNMRVKFDDFVWDEIRKNILNNSITSQNNMIDYINSNLIDHLLLINSSKKLHNYKKVTKPLVKARIVEKGFSDFKEYYSSIKKNHKVKHIEIVGGDDVYCMTVVGLNGEEDRHNFALTTWKSDGSLNESGVFVSNCSDQDIFIPTRDENAATPIDTLSAAQNLTAMDDIKFVQNKVLTALRIPKTFLNFEETAGDGKNLALMDIRFTRLINRIQQAFLMELTKVASIHLFLLGFNDELTNFTLSMNNPSTQAEQLEIENTQKKIDAVRDAVSDPGNGLPVMSQFRALKDIMGWSEKDIKQNLEEIRLEKGIVAELEKTTQIIKKTGIFDTVDKIYGEPGAEYMDDMQGGQGDMDNGMGGGMAPPPMGGGDIGGDLGELGSPNDDGLGGDIGGAEGSMPTQDMGNDPNVPMESRKNNKPLLTEDFFKQYMDVLGEHMDEHRITQYKRADVYDSETILINEEFDKMIEALGKFVEEK